MLCDQCILVKLKGNFYKMALRQAMLYGADIGQPRNKGHRMSGKIRNEYIH